MSLVEFHRSLIVVAIAFCFVYAAWETRAWLATDQAGAPVLAAAFGLLGLGLIVYLVRLRAILKLED